MYKKGDIIYCKKDYQRYFMSIYKGSCYKVHYSANNITMIIVDEHNLVLSFLNLENEDGDYIGDYFYTKEEMRKEKLKKLCTNKEI